MKMIGLVGGMSWESTALYYAQINQGVRARLGGNHSAQILLHSFDFAPVAEAQHSGAWDEIGDLLATAALGLERGGAEAILICTNTMHVVAERIETALSVPLLHIADPVIGAARALGVRKMGMLGTCFTMEQPFLRERLERGGLTILVPHEEARGHVHRIIYEELCAGIVSEASRATYREVIREIVTQGAEAVILGCTEIGMLVGPGDSVVPLIDTTVEHAKAAVDFLLGGAA